MTGPKSIARKKSSSPKKKMRKRHVASPRLKHYVHTFLKIHALLLLFVYSLIACVSIVTKILQPRKTPKRKHQDLGKKLVILLTFIISLGIYLIFFYPVSKLNFNMLMQTICCAVLSYCFSP